MTSITRSLPSGTPTIAAFTTTGAGTSSPMSRAIASPSMRYGGESTVRPSTSRYHATAASTSGTHSAVCASPVITSIVPSRRRTAERLEHRPHPGLVRRAVAPRREHAFAQLVAAHAQRRGVVEDGVGDPAGGLRRGRVHVANALPAFPQLLRLGTVLLVLDRGGRLVGGGEHVGLDRPGHDLEDPDPELPDLGLQRLADRAHGRLARTVGTEERHRREHR